ncbi:MAG: hypothetical protein ABW007_21030 [Chitinophagaceae bacterium]
MKLTKIQPKYIYLFFFCLMAVVLCLFYMRYKMHLDTMESDKRVKVRIAKVVCEGNKDNQNYIVFRGETENEIVNVGKYACVRLQVGDSIEVLYNKEWNLYFPTVIDTTDDKWGMGGSIAFMLIALFYLLFSAKHKRNKKSMV